MQKITKAIILNAGEGKRLRPLTSNNPKCLLTLGKRTILDCQLTNLVKNGITEITIVVGYKSEKIIDFIKNEYSETASFKYVYNNEFSATNTIYSLFLALQHLDGPFILLNGDVVFTSKILENLIKSRHGTCLAISKHDLSDEDVKVIMHDELILSIGKHLKPYESDGEFIGVAKFSGQTNQVLKKKIFNIFSKDSSKNSYFELAIDSMLEEHDVYGIDITEFPCIEVDTKEDLETANCIVKNHFDIF